MERSIMMTAVKAAYLEAWNNYLDVDNTNIEQCDVCEKAETETFWEYVETPASSVLEMLEKLIVGTGVLDDCSFTTCDDLLKEAMKFVSPEVADYMRSRMGDD